jgi:hypothetical protein
MVSIPPPGGQGVLPDIPLKLSNAAPNSSVPAYFPLTMHAGRESVYAARFLPVCDLDRRTVAFLSRRALVAFKNPASPSSALTTGADDTGTAAYQATRLGVLAPPLDDGNPRACGKRGETFAGVSFPIATSGIMA